MNAPTQVYEFIILANKNVQKVK